ncbi:hypothetical protein PR202_gb18523 [Eleusine coracana subsp. coracana]|uniref:Uncharacterized protein n=1 Tax=Eleusine coracana subsp. coracana TaxID=191504 RepID=A0AAV5F3M1_ELECO|nr:hypothetical protein PR202_gb18523 [Eleusine coracana subsp. coracana]
MRSRSPSRAPPRLQTPRNQHRCCLPVEQRIAFASRGWIGRCDPASARLQLRLRALRPPPLAAKPLALGCLRRSAHATTPSKSTLLLLRRISTMFAASSPPRWGGERSAVPFLSPASSKRRYARRVPSLPKPPLAPPAPPFIGRRKRKPPSRLWMRLDRRGGCEIFMCDKAFVTERSGVHARDLRVVGPLLSRSPSILDELMLFSLSLACTEI